MKYTESNIDGLKFQVNGVGTIYTINVSGKGGDVQWNGGKRGVNYGIVTILQILNSGKWVVINKEIEYEIY